MNSNPPIKPPLIDAKAAAHRLGLSPRKVWELTNTGELPAVRIGRAVRYEVADLEAFIARNRRAGR